MIAATSPLLNRPLRSLAEVVAHREAVRGVEGHAGSDYAGDLYADSQKGSPRGQATWTGMAGESGAKHWSEATSRPTTHLRSQCPNRTDGSLSMEPVSSPAAQPHHAPSPRPGPRGPSCATAGGGVLPCAPAGNPMLPRNPGVAPADAAHQAALHDGGQQQLRLQRQGLRAGNPAGET